ncbi:DNA (cytosine-5-)-methyltransferase [Blastopirellula marina]|uniref:DNA (cytosine-5-)-methyltransferase n=2 Tax=Pirellulales TaxID=2691354 RepID=A0A2S8G581_9BACT|nr:DNA (cytosine-5-)-methyltransferase [Blastopirellula marina]RCS55729.1 DNA cytosine methyltransferase [Bremerella cremea]
MWTFAEFFSGIGLVRMGLEDASSRWKCSFANDFDPVKCEIYRNHFARKSDELMECDVNALQIQRVPVVDLATASFPCTDLSLAGSRMGLHSGQSSAFWGFARLLESMTTRNRPRLIMLENVTGLLNSHGGEDLRTLLRSINSLGYSVDPFILDAKWFVPQSRPRLFIVCAKKSFSRNLLRLYRRVEVGPLRSKQLAEFISQTSGDIEYRGPQLPQPEVSNAMLPSVIEDPPDEHKDWWNTDRRDYLYDQMFERHQSWVQEFIGSSHYHYATAFRRVRPQPDGSKRSMAELRTDGIAGCLRTPKGGSGRQILVRAGKGKLAVRLVSPRECAALMGARGYNLDGVSASNAYFAFGDGVCVDAIRWISKNYLEPLLHLVDGRKYLTTGSNGRSKISRSTTSATN